jgi:glycosyltransferase involved in cell wall biosynthesis
MNELISIVIPTYNWSNVLKLAIKSVLWQTYQNFEIIVVGDGCTDDSEEVVRSFNDSRIRWFNLEKNSGSQSIPNNVGIEKANGEWIAHLGHDDIWHPNHLEYLLRCSDDALFRYSTGLYIGPDNEETEFKDRFVLFGFDAYEQDQEKIFHIPPSCIMYKKYIYEKIGEWKDYKEIYQPPDIEYILRALKFSKDKIGLTKKLTVFKFNSAWRRNSYILKPNHQQLQFIEKIEKNPNFFDSIALNLAIFLRPKLNTISHSNPLTIEESYGIISKYFDEIASKRGATLLGEYFEEKGYGVKQSRIYRGLDKI